MGKGETKIDYSVRNYTRYPQTAWLDFSGDFTCAPDVRDFLEARPDVKQWFLVSAQWLSETTVLVVLRTNEYLSPESPDASLRLHAVILPNHTWSVSLA